jgi:hypothetical protein
MRINDYVAGRAAKPAGLTRVAPAAEDFCHGAQGARESVRIQRAAADGMRQIMREQVRSGACPSEM